MTKQELNEWLETATFICTESQSFDLSGNEDVVEIWEKDGKFYKLFKCNSSYCEEWGEKGRIRGVYIPKECRKEERVVTVTVWVPVDQEP